MTATLALIRMTRVKHTSPDIAGATDGRVLATFNDLQGDLYAAVQWKGGLLTLVRTEWLESHQ